MTSDCSRVSPEARKAFFGGPRGCRRATDRDRQHRAKKHAWIEIDFDVPVTLHVPPSIRLVVAEEAARMILRPVYNRRRACSDYPDAEWTVALAFAIKGLKGGGWLPDDWKENVCLGRTFVSYYWACAEGCRQPDRCPR